MSEPPPLWAEIVGWYGTLAILGAYALSSLGVLDTREAGHARIYQGLNLTGAVGIVVVSYFHSAWQPLTLNAFWAAIALVALFRRS